MEKSHFSAKVSVEGVEIRKIRVNVKNSRDQQGLPNLIICYKSRKRYKIQLHNKTSSMFYVILFQSNNEKVSPLFKVRPKTKKTIEIFIEEELYNLSKNYNNCFLFSFTQAYFIILSLHKNKLNHFQLCTIL